MFGNEGRENFYCFKKATKHIFVKKDFYEKTDSLLTLRLVLNCSRK